MAFIGRGGSLPIRFLSLLVYGTIIQYIFYNMSQVLHSWKSDTTSVPMQILGEDLPDVLIDV